MFWSKPKTNPELEQAIAAFIETSTSGRYPITRRAVKPFVFDIDGSSALVRIAQHPDGRIYLYGWTGHGKEPANGPRRRWIPDKQGTFFGQFVNGRWNTIKTTVTGLEWDTQKFVYPTRRK